MSSSRPTSNLNTASKVTERQIFGPDDSLSTFKRKLKFIVSPLRKRDVNYNQRLDIFGRHGALQVIVIGHYDLFSVVHCF